MISDNRLPSSAKVILILILLSFVGLGFDAGAELESMRFGKSDVTISTYDVASAGLEVPDEYSDEVAMIQFSDNEPIEGETIDINVTVFNIGTRSASITVYFYDGPPVDNDLIGTDTLEILPLGHEFASTPWDTKGEAEFHTIFVLLNPDDPANESDEDNNQASKDIVVNQIPFADAGIDLEGSEDDKIYFDATGSTDTYSDISVGLIYTWQFNDPNSNDSNPDVMQGINMTNPSHTFTDEGIYEVNLTVIDDGGASAFDMIKINVANIKPDARFELSKISYYEDEEILFDSSSSTDSESDIPTLQFIWDFGDGSTTEWMNDSTVSYSYKYSGTYDVNLFVKDDNNATDSFSLSIFIDNVQPIADAGSDIVVYNNKVQFNGSGSSDTHSDLPSLIYIWDFGDGFSDTGRDVSHRYTDKGTYTVILKVLDDDNASDTDSIKVTINNLSPTAVITDLVSTALEDEEIIFNGSNSVDPDGTIIKYRWDFGDGEFAEGKKTSHSFPKAGIYTVTLIVEDDDNVLNRITKMITVLNFAPISDAGEDREVYEAEKIIFNGGNSNDTPSDIESLRYFWDFGDGSTAEGLIVNHSYSKAGIYEVILEVIDDDGKSSISKLRVYVRNVLLSSITISAVLEPSSCGPEEQITIEGQIEFDFVESISDSEFAPAKLRIEILETEEVWNVIPDRQGNFEFKMTSPVKEGTYTVRLSITRLGILEENLQTLEVTAHKVTPQPEGGIASITTIMLVTAVAVSAGGAGAFVAGTDLGRFKFFTLLIPLYSRLNRKAVLDNFTRGRIYEHIRINPGEHYRAIKNTLELNNGSLTYHLRVLENENFIQSRTDGIHKRFYPAGMKITKGQPHNIQELILEKLTDTPYLTQKQLAEVIGIDISTVNYHINIMAGAGIIQSEKLGKSKHYFVSTEPELIAMES
jgi:PKD repeat protein/DNA-binding MarR family transcriptional regulator